MLFFFAYFISPICFCLCFIVHFLKSFIVHFYPPCFIRHFHRLYLYPNSQFSLFQSLWARASKIKKNSPPSFFTARDFENQLRQLTSNERYNLQSKQLQNITHQKNIYSNLINYILVVFLACSCTGSCFFRKAV